MKILYYIYGLNIGGAETFIFHILENIDTSKYHIDFAIQSEDNTNQDLIKLCKKKKCCIYKIKPFKKNPLQNYLQTVRMIRESRYDLIHYHANAFINMVPVLAAKANKKPCLVHAHNTSSNAGRIGNIVHRINRRMFAGQVIRAACGKEAGEWMYGAQSFKVLNNAIPIKQYGFSSSSRKKIRAQYRIEENCLMVGHIGRFVPAKNHKFLIECFKALKTIVPEVKLLMVGDGELRKDVEEAVKNAGLNDSVYFAGNVHNTQEYYAAFDCMLFPSLFEGLPFTLVEAQASGLPVIVSDAVTKDVDVTGLLKYICLDEQMDVWVAALKDSLYRNEDRNGMWKVMKESRYDIDTVIKSLEKLYGRYKRR